MAQRDIGNKTPLHELKTTNEVMNYYDEWSKGNKYNKDMHDWEYSGPKETSEILAKYQKNIDIQIYDAGCGSGLVGLELKKYGFYNFDGSDISKELLKQVPKYLYNELKQVDLNKNILKKDNFYDVVMCVGTFTFAHVKAHALDEFVRITKRNGLICFTINEAIYIDYGFKSKIESLVNNNKIKEIEFFKSNYLASKDVNAWLGLYKVL
ncbi:MAG: class I SAM-dependent methyltransferase [Candidatus Pelagibacter sp. TMED118]|nr:MAG: class I SAM-dependent methyltransferase [Candidatus Pelagibacter sp. TMED118]|tara:strand:+ start:1797 stop:2423 length:627 start_codon:yes stop_codon:yes gene_type:complete